MFEKVKDWLRRIFKPWHIKVRVNCSKGRHTRVTHWDVRRIPMVGEGGAIEGVGTVLCIDRNYINEGGEIILNLTMVYELEI